MKKKICFSTLQRYTEPYKITALNEQLHGMNQYMQHGINMQHFVFLSPINCRSYLEEDRSIPNTSYGSYGHITVPIKLGSKDLHYFNVNHSLWQIEQNICRKTAGNTLKPETGIKFPSCVSDGLTWSVGIKHFNLIITDFIRYWTDWVYVFRLINKSG